MFQMIRNDMNIPFVKWRWIGFVISSLLVMTGIFAAVQIGRGKARLGVDFGGGSSLEIKFEKPIGVEQLRSVAKSPEFQDVSIQNIFEPGQYKFMIRVFSPSLPTEQVSTRMGEVLKTNLAENPALILSSEDVGPAVSAKLREQALMAFFWAMVGILIYIWWRFDFRFAVAATVATLHDVLAVMGILFLFGFEVNLLMLTALLTIAGYSLNDTVVIFDRIRENLRLKRKEEYTKIIDGSVNETISRTIITSLATFFVVVALVAFAGEVIYTFSFAMMIGIIIGCYSTIFVASNMLAEWHLRSPVQR